MAQTVLRLDSESGRLKEMLYPTMTAMVLGILFVAAIAAVDWYVWSAAGVASFRRPVKARPLTARDLFNKFLGRVVEANAEVLPASVMAREADASAAKDDNGNGFKKVA
jgi:hypothetical protein